jgi:hypothetical protein
MTARVGRVRPAVNQTETHMKQSALVLLVVLMALASQVAIASADHWCSGAHDEKLGTNFGTCPGPKH